MRVCVRLYLYVCVCVSVCMCLYVCVCVCKRVCVCALWLGEITVLIPRQWNRTVEKRDKGLKAIESYFCPLSL